jgi:hypothetical protein
MAVMQDAGANIDAQLFVALKEVARC